MARSLWRAVCGAQSQHDSNDRAVRSQATAHSVSNEIKLKCVDHFNLHGVKSAVSVKTFSNRFPQYKFSITTIRRLKKQVEEKPDDSAREIALNDGRGRPNFIINDLVI